MNGKQLKNSILQWAIQGRLVPQDPTDEPASQLLRRIQAEKAKLVKEGKLKKAALNDSRIFRGEDNKYYEKTGKTLTCIDEDIPFEIPQTWEWVRLGNMISVITGTAYQKNDVRCDGVRILRGGNIQDYQLRIYDDDVFLPNKYENRERNIRVNDIIVVASTGSNVVLGKPAFVKTDYPNTQVGAFLRIVRPHSKLCADYIDLIFQTNYYRESVRRNIRGTNIYNLSQETLNKLLLPLPPLAEQRRIVAKLEEVLSVVERYEKAQDALDALCNSLDGRLRKSILSEAIQGHLVPQDPTDEPASVLLQRIQAEKAKLVKEGKLKKSALSDSHIFRGEDNKYYEKTGKTITCIDEDIPFEIPETWEWVRTKDIFQINPKNEADDNVLSAFIPMEKIQATYGSEFSYDEVLWKNIKKGFTHFANGDVAFAKITPCFQNRKSAVFHDLPNGIGAGTTELKVLRQYGNTINPWYLLYFLETSYFIEKAKFKGTANQQRIASGYLEDKLFPLPPLAEQHRIVAKLEEVFAVLDRLTGK